MEAPRGRHYQGPSPRVSQRIGKGNWPAPPTWGLGLAPNEYSLLRYFIIHSGKMLGHKDILREVWGAEHSDDTQYLRVFVGQLRKKLETSRAPRGIFTTERGIGYRMEFLADLSPAQHSAAGM